MPPPLAITDVRYVGDPVARRRRREPLPRRGRVRGDRGRLRARSQPVVDYMAAAADTENIVHAGWGLESNTMAAVPFMPLSPDLDEAFAERRARRGVRRRAEPLRRHADGDPRDRRVVRQRVATSSTSCPRRSPCTRPATSSAASSRSPTATCSVTARDVGGGFGQKMFVYREECAVVLASSLLGRPVKWIEDRRENLLSAGALAQRVRPRAHGDRRRRHHPGHHRRRQGRRRRVPGVPRGDRPACSLPGPYKIPALRLLDGDDAGPTPWARPRTAGPWMFETTAREVAIDYAATRDRHRPRRVPAPQPARRVRPPVHRADRQRVPGDHPARDARAGARDPRLRRVPQGAGGRARAKGRLPRRRASACYVEPTSMGGTDAGTPRPPR